MQSWWAMLKMLPGATLHEWEDATAIRASVPTELANTLFVFERPSDPEGLLGRAREFFSGWNPWRILASAEGGGGISSAIGSTMKLKPGDPGMLLSPIPEAPVAPRSLTIERVSSPSQLADFRRATSSSFGIPMFAVRRLFPSVPTEASPFMLHVGYAEGRAVGSSETVIFEGVAGIYNVGVTPNSRRRGFGQALTWAAVETGRSRGCDVSFLEASEMGLPVYQRMGFRVVTEYPEWNARVSALKRAIGALGFLVGSLLEK
jgi:ribosomal protein S18 acetylase RimI-like enzyme